MYLMFQELQAFNLERLKDRVHQNSSLQMDNNKPIASVLSFNNAWKMGALHKIKKKKTHK